MGNQGSGELDLHWKGGRDFRDYPAATCFLMNGNSEAQDGQESDLRSQWDSRTLLLLTPPA